MDDPPHHHKEIGVNISNPATALERACTMLIVLTLVPPKVRRTPGPREGARSDRGDVPGWVMITMMTAIVVIALLVVFRKAVLDAVGDAFRSITDSG